MKTLTWQKPGQQNVAQELIKIIINYVAELRINLFFIIDKFEMFVYNFIVIDAPNREGAPDWPDFMYSGKLFPTGLLNI